MLHRSFSNLERNGMNCTYADQRTATTKVRPRAVCGAACVGRIVAKITFVQLDIVELSVTHDITTGRLEPSTRR